MKRPAPTKGLRHVALNVRDMDVMEGFYVGLLGMEVEWRPDPDNLYLTSGNDNLALHRPERPLQEANPGTLDHIGFIMGEPEAVDAWYDYLLAHHVPMKSSPKTHRDGARSFYCADPEGTVVQMIYHPPIAHR